MTIKIKLKLSTPKKVVLLFLITILLPAFILMPVARVKAQTYTDISVQTAYDMINNNTQYPNLIMLDVREQSEYDENHLCDAILIPRLEIDSRINELEPYKDTEIIVYCKAGSRSAEASLNLVNNHNFTKVFNMVGGIDEWIAEGYPVCTNGQLNIDFNVMTFSLILLSTMILVIMFYKKKVFRIRE